MNKRYAAALAVAAGVVLVTGALFRPQPPQPKHAPLAPQPAPVRGTEMRQMSDFLSGRAQSVAKHLVWVASVEATGVQWSDGQIVTVGTPPAIVRTAVVTTASQPQPVTLSPLARFDQGGWIVIAARGEDGSMVTASGLLGGVAGARCGAENVRRLLFNIPLDGAYAGGGVFGMSGNLLGVIARCGSGWMGITHDSVEKLLQQQLGPEAVTWHEFGVRTREASELEIKILRLQGEGVFVGEVRRASSAANMGIRPGDLIQVPSPGDLLQEAAELEVLRNGRRLKLPVKPPYSLEPRAGGALLTSMQPDTELAKAGLQPGDRLLNPEVLTSRRPSWLLYERDDRQIGVLLP